MLNSSILTTVIVMLVVIHSVSSHLEGNIGEFHFTMPDVTGNFNDAVSWCKANNSTLAVVNDSYTQTALAQFLNSSQLNSTMFINLRLYKEQEDAWFLVNGTKYDGIVGNTVINGTTFFPNLTKYSIHCRLRYDVKQFIVDSSAPIFRSYICDFEENRCTSDSANNVVYSGRCYVKYENESLTWYQARERCINSGGDLAQFLTSPLDRWIPPFNTSFLNTSLWYWIGIRYKNWSWKPSESNQENIFTSWSHSEITPWWSKGEPNNYTYECVCLDPNGNPPWSWTDCNCTVQRQFVCLKRISSTTTTPRPLENETGVYPSTSAPENKSEALIVGLLVGIGIPLLIIILILVVVIVRHRRQQGEKPRSNESVTNSSETASVTDVRSSAETAVSTDDYQHLQTVRTMPLYDQLNQPETQEYELID